MDIAQEHKKSVSLIKLIVLVLVPQSIQVHCLKLYTKMGVGKGWGALFLFPISIYICILQCLYNVDLME